LLPFVVLYAKEYCGTQNADTGYFLLLKVIGSVAAGLLLFALAGRFKYRYCRGGKCSTGAVSPPGRLDY